jgi:hypothetical protein
MAIRRTLFPMRNRVLTSVLVSVLALGSLSASFGDAKGVPNANASGYWNEERRSNAVPREFQFEVGATEGKLVPQARKGGSGGGSTTMSGTSYWPITDHGNIVAGITGKVYFTMSGRNYVCSGSLVEDSRQDIAVVITAAHCVFDNATKVFATDWAFIPNYDKDAGSLKGSTYYSSILYAPTAFTNQGSFNTTAILNDFAFAVLPTSELNLSNLPTISLATSFAKNKGDAFGYPASIPFDGEELVYSTGNVSSDRNTGNKTWRLPSSMTGGASGGPWYNDYINGNSIGAVSSVNSYKYNSDKNSMYGPKFSSLTNDLYSAAKSGTCPVIKTTINCK